MNALVTQIAKEQAKAKREHLELTFKQQLKAVGLGDGWTCEHIFHPIRKWRFDLAWPDKKLAIEVNGGTKYGKSRHSYGDGIENDYEKLNAAQSMGWVVFSFTGNMIKSGKAILFVQDFLKGN